MRNITYIYTHKLESSASWLAATEAHVAQNNFLIFFTIANGEQNKNGCINQISLNQG